MKKEGQPPRVIGYLRVSTEAQDLDKNRHAILHLANEKNLGRVEWLEEKITGTKDWKDRKLGEIINNTLERGDVLIISELSRLGRSMLQIMEILKIATDKGIRIFAIKGNWELGNSMQSKILAMVFGMLAEIERDLISARTKEALAARKLAGVNLGRPRGPGKSKLDQHREEIVSLMKTGSTKRYLARRYEVSEQNFYNWLRKNKIDASPDL